MASSPPDPSTGSETTSPPLAAPDASTRPGPAWVRRHPLAVTNATYGTLYAVDGVIITFLSVYLSQVHGLSTGQIGSVLAISAVAAIVAPPLFSIVADRYGRAETLFMLLLVVSSLALAVFGLVGGYAAILAVYTWFCLAREPSRPLLDGIFFTSQRTVPELADVSYHRVRIWATFGYMVPGILLFFALRGESSLRILPWIASGLAIVGVVVSYFLPTRGRTAADRAAAAAVTAGRPQVSLGSMLGAVGRLARNRSLLLFVLAMFLMQASMAIYGGFYPLLATEGVGMDAHWLGVVSNLGVLIELAYMAAFGWFVRRLGWRWLMVLGSATAALRVGLLAAVPTVGVVVGSQVLHGMVIIVTMVAGRILLDKQAPDEIRHTAQGLYAMIVLGGGRVVGSSVGGWVASGTLAAAFWTAAAAAAVAAVVLFFALREVPE